MGSEAIGPVMIAVARFPIARKTSVSPKYICVMQKNRWP